MEEKRGIKDKEGLQVSPRKGANRWIMNHQPKRIASGIQESREQVKRAVLILSEQIYSIAITLLKLLYITIEEEIKE